MAASNSRFQRLYPSEMRERAVRMVREAIAESGERIGAVTRVARQLGIGPESLRNWVYRSPISANGLHLLIAALRSFYTVMQRGAFDTQDQRYHPLYAFGNPMYSKVLVAWRSEHRKWIRNAGAPDHAGIRSDSARQPVGLFQVRVQPLEPPVARHSESTRLAILAGVRYMIDHALAREAVILRVMLESGARVSEVLARH